MDAVRSGGIRLARHAYEPAGPRPASLPPTARGDAGPPRLSLPCPMPWTTLCDLDELVEDRGLYVDIDGRELAVFLHGGRPFVMENTCPHAGGSLSSGHVEEIAGVACAVCPVHCWP